MPENLELRLTVDRDQLPELINELLTTGEYEFNIMQIPLWFDDHDVRIVVTNDSVG